MIEIMLAALAPAGAAWLLSSIKSCNADLRRATRWWFIPLVLLWFSPCILTGRSPAAFDYLAQDIWPWKQPGFTAGNALLSDVPLQFAPWREVAARALRHGELPFLNRDAGSGSALWANPQSAVLYPINLAALPLSTFAWPLFAAVAKILLALTGTYLLLRSLGTTHEAGILGSIAYAFSGFTIAFLLFPHTNVTVLLPWILLAIDLAAESWRGAAFFAVVLLVAFSGGHPESMLQCAFLAVPYAVRHWRSAGRVVLAGIAGCCLAAPLLVPAAVLLPSMERSARVTTERGLVDAPEFTAANLSAFVFPYALRDRRSPDAVENFNEVATQYAGIATFLLMLFCAVRQPRRNAFWIVAFLAFTVLAFRSSIFRGVPILGETLQGRVRFLLAFITSVLAARGFDLLPPHRFRRAIPLVVAADLALLLFFYNPPVARRFFYPATPAVSFLRKASPPFRILGIGDTMRPNSSAIASLEDVGVHDPSSFEPYAALLARGGYDRRTYFNAFHALPPKPLLDFLGVRYVIAPPRMRSSALPVVYAGLDATILENRGALPRFRAAPSDSAAVHLEHYRQNGATIEVVATRAAHIVTSEVALPGWSLRRDGEEWPLQHAGPFLVWTAPPGTSRFELRYVPAGLRAGSVLAVVGLAMLFIFLRLPVRSEIR